ncbi:solute carrier family 22 member 6-B-like [Bufo gargarizans]|uniref:solute carrier family 22 member 6-B-like n=1 Tax=Bufo gargarizans TaxID=30331 RepID=UPI001CF4B897|nr:solute carrier family 22 member 6-B-like [Bufo gargarizans]XP_044126238.1 solute carrier family 22 member 6-B-like [Bufo gargarizans]XP_044126239.1 solute carrier family 22 member 6-B-like [Bufo gargarizans]XP_044126240.1 solute carrier family 22 member 6-B-like [Bufo gargarizans]XP_044126241.1 solute carrier family 22 member 6-B-like [Bufo gargarizans]
MALSDALEKDSLFSPFQSITVTFLCTPLILVATHNLMQVFTAAVPPYHCQSNLTLNNSYLPKDPCTRYISLQLNDTEPCMHGERIYDLSLYTSTIVSEWDLVCEREWMKELAQSTYMAGVLVGAILYGSLADRYGRRTIILGCLLQVATMGTGAAFSPNFTAYCIFRFMTGMGICGLLINDLGLTIEWIPKKYRPTVSTVQGVCLTFGQIILAAVAYVITDWRWLQLALSLPYFIFPIFVWWVPESYRWLALNKRSQQALWNLNRAARINGERDGTFITLEMLNYENEKNPSRPSSKPTPLDLFRTPAMRKVTIILSMSWFSSSFCFFALAMDIQRFGFSLYLLQVIFGTSELLLRILSIFVAAYVGRRFSVFMFLVLSGVLILCSLAIPSDLILLQLSATALAKGFLGASIVCAYLYTTELFPTVLRQTGVGFTNMMMRLGAVIAPLAMMTKVYALFLPLVIFGLTPIVFGLPVLRLPETLNSQLLDTVEEVEARDQKAKLKTEKEPEHGTKL